MTPIEQYESIMQMVASAPPEVQARLQASGMVIPLLGKDARITIRWGYRCPQCNRIGLYFIGDRFIDFSGNELDRPSSSVPIDQIAWRQDLPAASVNRHSPTCQSCGHELPLHHRAIRTEYLVECESWEDSRRAAEKELERQRRLRTMGGGTMAEMAESSNRLAAAGYRPHELETQQTKRINDHLSPEAKADIRAADRAGFLLTPKGHST
jgi:hypothetical protein